MWRSLCAGLVLVSSCAGTPAAKRDTAVAEVDAKARADRRRQRQVVRDLENELARLKAEVGTMRRGAVSVSPQSTESPPSGADDPDLPIDVLSPQNDSLALSEGADGDVVVAGYDEEGVEILYVGEAARAPSIRPDIELSGTGTPTKERRPTTTPARVSTPASAPALPAVATTSDRLEVTAAVGPKAGAAPRVRAAKVPSASAPVQARSARDDYRAAYEALKRREHTVAIAGFREFLRRYPKDDYADNAQYWLAEAYYDQRQFETALTEFDAVIKTYPRGNKATGAMLKIAYCHAALGNAAQAKSLLEKLIAEHPNTGPARLAADKLKSL